MKKKIILLSQYLKYLSIKLSYNVRYRHHSLKSCLINLLNIDVNNIFCPIKFEIKIKEPEFFKNKDDNKFIIVNFLDSNNFSIETLKDILNIEDIDHDLLKIMYEKYQKNIQKKKGKQLLTIIVNTTLFGMNVKNFFQNHIKLTMKEWHIKLNTKM